MAARGLALLTLAVAAGCYAHGQPGRYPYEGNTVCDYYGPYGPRSSYYYAPGTDLGVPHSTPNDHLYYGGGPTLGYGGGPLLYGPMPPGYCPRDK
jgi:hypothetical protein